LLVSGFGLTASAEDLAECVAKARSFRFRHSEHALAEDVALDLAGARGDRHTVGIHVTEWPAAAVRCMRVVQVEGRAHSLDLERARRDLLADLGAEQLGLQRQAHGMIGERLHARASPELLQRLEPDQELQYAVADHGIVPRAPAAAPSLLGEIDQR